MVAAGDEEDGIELARLFLERGSEAEISEYVLMAAACNPYQGSEIMQLLLKQTKTANLTENVLICAAQYFEPTFVPELLEHSKTKVITGSLLEAAAANLYWGGNLMTSLLAKADITDFPEDVLIKQ